MPASNVNEKWMAMPMGLNQPQLQVMVDGAVGVLTISNPAKKNAMTLDMWRAFVTGMEQLDSNESVRTILVRGDGDVAFMSGADISQFNEHRASEAQQASYDQAACAAYAAPGKTAKPVIALIRGICIGGGLGIAAACDIRICSTDARFRMPAARLGLGYDVQGVRRFVQLIGPQNTLDIFSSARFFDAQEALRMGFVTSVVPGEEIDAHAWQLARGIASNAPLTVRAAKLAVEAALNPSDQTEQAAQAAAGACSSSQDYVEGRSAFGEKRQPRFLGR